MDRIDSWLNDLSQQNKQFNQASLQTIMQRLRQHPDFEVNALALANCILTLNPDQSLLEAALLYYLSPTCSATQISKLSSPTVSKLVSTAHNLEQIEVLSQQSSPSRQGHADNLRKMLLAIIDDVRVVALKLAEQLVRLQSLKTASAMEQQLAATVVTDIYAPLANRLGIGQLKWQLEDWAFRYQNPTAYQDLKKHLNMRRQDREQYVNQAISEVKQLLDDAGIKHYDISGRAKHIYSIYKKIQRKQVEFDEIYDAIALRVLVNNIEECYTALGAIHSQWQPIAKEFDDYIANPKANGYRSIHTAVIGSKNINFEIQIRTHQMHNAAELGVAAHWAYKEGGISTSTYDEKINWLRQVMDWQQELSGQEQQYKDIFSDRIYVFTPQGDIVDLPEKATPLDFAYYVHSDIGHRCRGAKINGKLEPLSYQLKTGDVVAIQTAKESKPSRDWLNPDNGYLQSSKARSKVAHWFRRQNYQENIEKGQALWEKTFRSKNIDKQILQTIYQHYNFKSMDGLLAAMGCGEISTAAISQHLQQNSETDGNPVADNNVKLDKQKSTRLPRSSVNIAGVDNLLSQLARCCKPIPGDAIIGYITQGRGVTIHRSDCSKVLQAQKDSPQRIISTEWGDSIPSGYLVDLLVEANDAQHIIRDITQLIAAEKIPLIAIHSQANRIDGSTTVQVTIEINDLDTLRQFTQKLIQLPGVDNIHRS